MTALVALLLGLALAAPGVAAGAEARAPRSPRTFRVSPAVPGSAQAAIERAESEDVVVLRPGVHEGPLRIRKAIHLRGEPGAIVFGGRAGTVIEVSAPGAVLEDFEVRGSGRRIITIDSGIKILGAGGVTLRRLRMQEVLYGVYAERASHLVIEGCRLTGLAEPLKGGDGNGIHLWNTHDAWLVGNIVERFQDAIYLSFAFRTRVERCRLQYCGRYGLHTMYCQENRLLSSVFTRNEAGCALMFTNRLEAIGNDFIHNRGPRTYGLLLTDCSDGEFRDNRLVDNTIGAFLDNSNRNRFSGNLVQDNGWGLLIFSSCEGNEVAGNTFLNNDYPVSLDMRRTNNRFDDGRRGNFWSENAPYDLDADGVSDVPFSPVTAFAFLSKQYPDLAILAAAPAVVALTVAERVFPSLRPSEAVDRHPLVAPPAVARRGGQRGRAGGADGVPPVGAEAAEPLRRSPLAVAGFGALFLGAGAALGWRRWR
jgi:nitrous oxidase accessory protein